MNSIEQVVAALNQARVKYIVVGGVAVVLHGYLRTTADLDLVVELSEENTSATISALEALGFQPRAPVSAKQFSDPNVRQSWIDDKGMVVFCMWSELHPGLEIDLFVSEPFDFCEVYARALTVPLDSTSVTVVALDDLIALKRQANRPQDIADIAALQALQESEHE